MPTTIVGRSLVWPAYLLFVLLYTTGRACADEVLLTNGDRLTGTIVEMQDRILTLQTTYGGQIKIAWGAVEKLTSVTPITLKVPGNSHGLFFDFLIGGYDFIEVNALSANNPVPLSDVKGINIGYIQYQGNFTLGGNNTSGNTDTKAVNGAARLAVRADRNRFALEARYNYGKADGRVTAQNSMAQAKYDYFISKRVFVEAFELWEKDKFQDLEIRNTLGASIGYQIFDTGHTNLSGSTGMGYIYEDYTNVPQTQTVSAKWGGAFRAKATAEQPDHFS